YGTRAHARGGRVRPGLVVTSDTTGAAPDRYHAESTDPYRAPGCGTPAPASRPRGPHRRRYRLYQRLPVAERFQRRLQGAVRMHAARGTHRRSASRQQWLTSGRAVLPCPAPVTDSTVAASVSGAVLRPA